MGRKTEESAKSYPIRVSTVALQNIDEITGYISFIALQPLNAVRVGDGIFATIDRISASLFAFKECRYLPTKKKMYRQARCLSWYIVYKIASTEILILGIIHASRRPTVVKALHWVK